MLKDWKERHLHTAPPEQSRSKARNQLIHEAKQDPSWIITSHPAPIRLRFHADQKWTNTESQETNARQGQPPFYYKPKITEPVTAAFDLLKQESVLGGTYLTRLQTRPTTPQYMLILEHTGGQGRFTTERVDLKKRAKIWQKQMEP